MATAPNVLRTCGLLLCLIFQAHSSAAQTLNLTIQSLQVGSITCDNNTCKYLLSVSGGEFLGHNPWRLSPEEGAKGSSCEIIYPNYEIKEIETSQWTSKIEVSVPNVDGKIYFCLREKTKNAPYTSSWVHQGLEHVLEPKKDVAYSQKNELSNTTKSESNILQEQETETQETQNISNVFNKNGTQEVNPEWADLTHDIDVNYLPNVPRPTREEKNDIEVLVNHKYVPLNDLIEQIEIDSKKSIDILDYRRENDMDNNINDIVQEGNKEPIKALNSNVNNEREYLDTMKSYEKFDYAKEIIDKIDLALYKLKYNDSKTDMTNVNLKVDETNNLSNDISLQDITTNEISSHLPYKENKKDNMSNRKVKSKEILDKLDELIAKIKPIQCCKLQAYLTDMHSLGINLPDVLASNIDLPDLPSFAMHSSGTNSHETPAPNTDSPDLRSFGMHSAGMPSTGMHSSDVHSPNMHSPDTPQELRRKKRQFLPEVPFSSVRAVMRPLLIEGIRVEDSDKEPKIIENGIPSVLAESSVTLRVFGEGITERTVIAFTHDPQPYGQPCKFLLKGEYMVKEGSLQPKTALFEIYAPAPITASKLYICAKNLHPERDTTNDEEKYLHQGIETWKMMASHNNILPLWVSISLILFCLMFSALFSGLNLGLMSLDRTELKIIANTGTEQERKYARAIMPVRDHGNYLLCSILLGNVAVNSTFTILLDELTSGLFAVIFSTLAIVMLGEITPQAICSRHGLMVGAKSIMVTKGVMAVTAPLSFPVSKLLDYFLGEEIGNVYNRERLKELVKVTTDVNDLDKDEVNIISGALEMRKKTVKDVMTKLEDVFMLPISSVLDFETMSEIVKSGYSRIPVYEGGRGNIVTVLFIKDLAFVDPDDNTPLRTLCQYYQNPAHFVFEDVTLDVMFKQFKDGHKGHMAFVHRINNEGEGDPYYETIGLVTLEDVIEEMIQSEIVDETDVFLDNRSKRRRRPQNKLQDFAAFAERHENQRIHISPQLTLATFQFLSTSVDAFRPDTVSETVLRRLLKQDVIQHIKIKEKTKRDPHTYVFQQGKPVDYFVLILEGRVEVTVGRENLVFEAGPFTYFGVQALTQNVGVAESPTPSAMGSLQNINMDAMLRHTFVPDYSVRAITSVFYLTVKRSLYLAAKRATLMEKGNISKGGTTQEFDTEVDKNLCISSSANIPISMISKKLFGNSTATLSTREDALSSTSGTKIYGIMQYSNSETCKDACKSNPEYKRTEVSKSSNAFNANFCHNSNEVDANSCVECLKNNFWINKSVLNKNVDDRNDFEQCKKKKATFHTDSSLLSFHNLSSTSHAADEIEYKSNNRELKSNHESPRHDVEFETRNVEFKLNRGSSKYKIEQKYIDVKSPTRNDRFYSRNPGVVIYTSTENCSPFRKIVSSETAKNDTDLDYIPENLKRSKLEYEIDTNQSKTNSKHQLDFQADYKPYIETDSSNQERKSNNRENDSTDPPDSIDRFLELERDTIDYEKEFREERLAVEKRRLETEQIIMMQLSKIISMLERKQT